MDSLLLSQVADYAADAHEQAQVLGTFVRTKTYIKEPARLLQKHPRLWPFQGQPVLWASERLQAPLNAVNEVAMICTAGCNLDCWFCFAGGVSPHTSRRVPFDEVYDELAATGKRVWRVSGGEPMLQASDVGKFVEYASDPGVRVFWVDTNLAVDPTPFLRELSGRTTDDVGVCGCFKGVSDLSLKKNVRAEATMKQQFHNARLLWDALPNVFFYVVDAVTADVPKYAYDRLDAFRKRLAEQVGFTAPLRTCFIELHPYNLGNWKPGQAPLRGVRVNELRREWDEVLVNRLDRYGAARRRAYEPELLWLPSHQVPKL